MESKKRLNEAIDVEDIISKFKKGENGEEVSEETKEKGPKEFYVQGQDAVSIKIVQSSKDIEKPGVPFHPTFTFQLFGNKEKVFGYTNLRINIMVTGASLYPYLKIEYDTKREEPDNLEKCFDELYKTKYSKDKESFAKMVEKDEKFKPTGQIIRDFTRDKDEYTVYKMNARDIEEMNINLQAMLYLFIDGISFINSEPYWNYYILYKRTGEAGNEKYSLIGYATTYESHQRVDRFRVRISQFLILPIYQRKGFGGEILEQNSSCFEITVEDPSDDFIIMKDISDTKMLIKNGYFSCFNSILKGGAEEGKQITAKTYPAYKLPKGTVKEAAQKMKLTKLQIERCFEILKFAKLDSKDPELVKMFRLDAKKRLLVMKRESLYPGERIDNITKGTIPTPVVIFEGNIRSWEENEDISEQIDENEVDPEKRNALLAMLYEEVESGCMKLRDKLSCL